MATLVDDVQWALDRSYTQDQEFGFGELKDYLHSLEMDFTTTSLHNVLYRLQLKGVVGKNGRNTYVYTPQNEVKNQPVPLTKAGLSQEQEEANLKELDTKESPEVEDTAVPYYRSSGGQVYIDTPQGRLHVDVDGTIWLSQKVGQLS